MGSGHLDKAALISAVGDSVWAKTAGFEVRCLPPRERDSSFDAGKTGVQI